MKKQIIQPCQLRTRLAQLGMKALDRDLYCTENFAWYELLTKQTELPTLQVLENLKKVAIILQKYRDEIFKCRIVITSGWRSKTYNQELRKQGYKASDKSFHCFGMALDFVIEGYTPKQVQQILDKVHKGGLEFASTWTHIDIRPDIVRFDENNNVIKANFIQKEHDKLFKAA